MPCLSHSRSLAKSVKWTDCLFHHYFCGLTYLLWVTKRIKILKSILGFFIPFLENPFPMILSTMKISLHSHSLITGIFHSSFQNRDALQRLEAQGDSGGSGFPPPWMPGHGSAPSTSLPPYPNPASLHRAVWTPPRRNLLCLKIVPIQQVKGSANNFPRQSEPDYFNEGLEMRLDTDSLASILSTALVKAPSPVWVSSGGAEGCFWFQEISLRRYLPFLELLFHSLRVCSHCFKAVKGPSLLVCMRFKFPLGRSGSLKEKKDPRAHVRLR